MTAALLGLMVGGSACSSVAQAEITESITASGITVTEFGDIPGTVKRRRDGLIAQSKSDAFIDLGERSDVSEREKAVQDDFVAGWISITWRHDHCSQKLA